MNKKFLLLLFALLGVGTNGHGLPVETVKERLKRFDAVTEKENPLPPSKYFFEMMLPIKERMGKSVAFDESEGNVQGSGGNQEKIYMEAIERAKELCEELGLEIDDNGRGEAIRNEFETRVKEKHYEIVNNLLATEMTMLKMLEELESSVKEKTYLEKIGKGLIAVDTEIKAKTPDDVNELINYFLKYALGINKRNKNLWHSTKRLFLNPKETLDPILNTRTLKFNLLAISENKFEKYKRKTYKETLKKVETESPSTNNCMSELRSKYQSLKDKKIIDFFTVFKEKKDLLDKGEWKEILLAYKEHIKKTHNNIFRKINTKQKTLSSTRKNMKSFLEKGSSLFAPLRPDWRKALNKKLLHQIQENNEIINAPGAGIIPLFKAGYKEAIEEFENFHAILEERTKGQEQFSKFIEKRSEIVDQFLSQLDKESEYDKGFIEEFENLKKKITEQENLLKQPSDDIDIDETRKELLDLANKWNSEKERFITGKKALDDLTIEIKKLRDEFETMKVQVDEALAAITNLLRQLESLDPKENDPIDIAIGDLEEASESLPNLLKKITAPLEIIETYLKEVATFADNKGDIEKKIEAVTDSLSKLKKHLPDALITIQAAKDLLAKGAQEKEKEQEVETKRVSEEKKKKEEEEQKMVGTFSQQIPLDRRALSNELADFKERMLELNQKLNDIKNYILTFTNEQKTRNKTRRQAAEEGQKLATNYLAKLRQLQRYLNREILSFEKLLILIPREKITKFKEIEKAQSIIEKLNEIKNSIDDELNNFEQHILQAMSDLDLKKFELTGDEKHLNKATQTLAISNEKNIEELDNTFGQPGIEELNKEVEELKKMVSSLEKRKETMPSNDIKLEEDKIKEAQENVEDGIKVIIGKQFKDQEILISLNSSNREEQLKKHESDREKLSIEMNAISQRQLDEMRQTMNHRFEKYGEDIEEIKNLLSPDRPLGDQQKESIIMFHKKLIQENQRQRSEFENESRETLNNLLELMERSPKNIQLLLNEFQKTAAQINKIVENQAKEATEEEIQKIRETVDRTSQTIDEITSEKTSVEEVEMLNTQIAKLIEELGDQSKRRDEKQAVLISKLLENERVAVGEREEIWRLIKETENSVKTMSESLTQLINDKFDRLEELILKLPTELTTVVKSVWSEDIDKLQTNILEQNKKLTNINEIVENLATGQTTVQETVKQIQENTNELKEVITKTVTKQNEKVMHAITELKEKKGADQELLLQKITVMIDETRSTQRKQDELLDQLRKKEKEERLRQVEEIEKKIKEEEEHMRQVKERQITREAEKEHMRLVEEETLRQQEELRKKKEKERVKALIEKSEQEELESLRQEEEERRKRDELESLRHEEEESRREKKRRLLEEGGLHEKKPEREIEGHLIEKKPEREIEGDLISEKKQPHLEEGKEDLKTELIEKLSEQNIEIAEVLPVIKNNETEIGNLIRKFKNLNLETTDLKNKSKNLFHWKIALQNNQTKISAQSAEFKVTTAEALVEKINKDLESAKRHILEAKKTIENKQALEQEKRMKKKKPMENRNY